MTVPTCILVSGTAPIPGSHAKFTRAATMVQSSHPTHLEMKTRVYMRRPTNRVAKVRAAIVMPTAAPVLFALPSGGGDRLGSPPNIAETSAGGTCKMQGSGVCNGRYRERRGSGGSSLEIDDPVREIDFLVSGGARHPGPSPMRLWALGPLGSSGNLISLRSFFVAAPLR